MPNFYYLYNYVKCYFTNIKEIQYLKYIDYSNIETGN